MSVKLKARTLIVAAAFMLTGAIMIMFCKKPYVHDLNSRKKSNLFFYISSEHENALNKNGLRSCFAMSSSNRLRQSIIPVDIMNIASYTERPLIAGLSDVWILYIAIDEDPTSKNAGIFCGLKVRFQGSDRVAVAMFDYSAPAERWIDLALSELELSDPR